MTTDDRCTVIGRRILENMDQNAEYVDCPFSEKSSVSLRPKSLDLRSRKNTLSSDEAEARHSWPSGCQDPAAAKLKRQCRVENKPDLKLKLESKERMRQETKLVILEFLSSLPPEPERISARYRRENRGPTSVSKAKTIHSSERPFLDVIEKRKRLPVTRRNSEEYDQKVREKLAKMAKPLRKRLTPEVLSDIKSFDKAKLKKETNGRKTMQNLPHLRFAAKVSAKPLDSPITTVTTRLDEMGQDIMKDYPQLLDEHLSELLTPLEIENKLTYEEFSVVAKTVFEKQLARFTGSIWTKVAMVFYLVKEVLYSGNLTDIQVELLVDYATRFITETSSEKIKKEGGWVALKENDEFIDQNILMHDIYNPLGAKDGQDAKDGPPSLVEEEPDTEGEETYIGMFTNTVKTWTTYSAAVMAVGIGFAYAYLKQQ